MTQTRALALVMMVIAAGTTGCKKQQDAVPTQGSGSTTTPAPPAPAPAPTPAPAPAPAPAPPAADTPYALPADARVVPEREARKADASSVGADVTLHVVDRIGTDDPGDPMRHVDQVVALSGTGAVVVEVGFVRDQDPAYHDHMIRPIAPLAPPRPFDKADAKVALKFKGPLLYTRQWKGGAIAVAHDGDAIVVWRSETLQGEGEDGQAQDFFEQARIKLAAGAKVTAQ